MYIIRKPILLIQGLFLGFDSITRRYESLSESIQNQKKATPIFIVGAPRSGTTLIFQQMIRQLQLVYISNLMALFPNQMLKIFNITASKIINYSEMKESMFGYISGVNSPNEAGKIFTFWFEKVPAEHKIELIRNTINYLYSKHEAPLVTKNVRNSSRLKNILKVFPHVKIVYIKRDTRMNAQSIILARRELGDEKRWFGVKPIGYEKVLKKDIFYQAVWQVFETEKMIENFIKNNNTNYYALSYEDFCKDTKMHIKTIASKFELKSKNNGFSKLESRNGIKLNKAEWNLLSKYTKKFEGKT
ncbi:MAG: sulfotransferase [Paludibacteraceae bacterium]|nr:sulfotransferase [Paludibacteraceae bacterium]